MGVPFHANIPQLQYLSAFNPDGTKPEWDEEATGIAPLTMFETFAGCMAPHLASVGLPVVTVAASEFAELQSHFIKVKTGIHNVGDITQPDVPDRVRELLNGSALHIIFGGSPCQPFSPAGKKKGMDDARAGEVMGSWLNCIHDLRPPFWFWENVERVRSDHTNGMGHLLGKGCGYLRPEVPMELLLADSRVATLHELLGEAFEAWADGNRAAAEGILDAEEFADRSTENSKFVETRRAQLQKDKGVPALAKAAILAGDLAAFLQGLPGLSSEGALAGLDAWAAFTPANHELSVPETHWSRSKGKISRRWPAHGVIYGPEYRLAWRQFDSQFFGVPQHRERIYLVAVRSDLPQELDPADIMFDFD